APVAVFSADGALVYATGDLDAETTLATFGADALKDSALNLGTATGATALGTLTLTRLGRGSTTVLVASLPEGAQEQLHEQLHEQPQEQPQEHPHEHLHVVPPAPEVEARTDDAPTA